MLFESFLLGQRIHACTLMEESPLLSSVLLVPIHLLLVCQFLDRSNTSGQLQISHPIVFNFKGVIIFKRLIR